MHPGAANLTMLHSHGLVRGAVEVARGLYYGGDLQHAAELVRCGDAAAVDFSFYRGRVDWQPGELYYPLSELCSRPRPEPRQGSQSAVYRLPRRRRAAP
jgi:hypothetical protein